MYNTSNLLSETPKSVGSHELRVKAGDRFPAHRGQSSDKALPAGASDFANVIEKGVFVDKTLFIRDLLDYTPGSARLFCRPRGFGKSLGLDMLQCFFETPVEGFGFTDAEVEALTSYAGMIGHVGEIRNRCGGWHFGQTDVCNPASVLRFLEKRDGENETSGDSGTDTSGDNSLEARLLQQAGKRFGAQLQTLVSKGSVETQLDVRSALEDVGWNPAALWSQLYLLGCVTTDYAERPRDPSATRRLRLPNREARTLFERAALPYSTIGWQARSVRPLYSMSATATSTS